MIFNGEKKINKLIKMENLMSQVYKITLSTATHLLMWLNFQCSKYNVNVQNLNFL